MRKPRPCGLSTLNKSLLDSDTFSEMFKGFNPTVAAHAKTYRRAFGHYTVSAVTVMEMVTGYRQKQANRQLQTYLAALATEEIIPFDRPAAELAGEISATLIRTGQTIGLSDPMIAATAIVHGLELVTGNTAHFERVQRLGYALTLVNWRN